MTAVLGGCTHGTISIRNLDGIGYTVEGTSIGVDDRDGTMRIYNERAALRVREGRLYRDDTELGAVRRGDRVLLARNGRVYVNGAERAVD